MTVALKVIPADKLNQFQDPKGWAVFIERFKQEMAALGKLRHKYIIQVLTGDEFTGQLFCVMEFISGGSLLDGLLRDGTGTKQPFANHDAARVIEQAARGIHAAHSERIIHRDVKPGNILLAADGSVRDADFGLARVIDATPTLTIGDHPQGTAAYMSPEHMNAPRSVDERSDVYSLGATLYQLLTAKYPFEPADGQSLKWQILEAEPTPPRQLNPIVHPDLQAICLKCLAKSPEDRYSTARELVENATRARSRRYPA